LSRLWKYRAAGVVKIIQVLFMRYENDVDWKNLLDNERRASSFGQGDSARLI
jgi:hypothetical protein